MKRELGNFENALVAADRHAPFHSVHVLRIESPPPPQMLAQALKSMQNRHPFLLARLLNEKGRYYFANLADPVLPCRILPRWNDDHWIKVTEVELDTRIELGADPLFRCIYLFDANQKYAEIILTFFHSIVDDASAVHLFDDLLTACASLTDLGTVTVTELPLTPAQESRFPSAFQGIWLRIKKLRYLLQQTADEISYIYQARAVRIPPVHKKTSRGRILTVHFPADFVETLKHRSRLEQVTLDALFQAAMLIAVNRRLYAGTPTPMRTFSSWDMRPFVKPPLGDKNLACYLSMLRHTLLVEGGADPWQLARQVQNKFYRSLRSGDHFIAATLAYSFLQSVTRAKSVRMGATALNFIGETQFKPKYGETIVSDIHSFVSPYDLGPEWSGQARFFNGQLVWDFTHLEADLSAGEARVIAEEIGSVLKSALSQPPVRI